jgi:uroporphyrinogen decarboxylase
MNDLFLRACRREPVDHPPIWIMRQAGRYLPEYRKVREQVDFVTLCRTPELAAKVTLQPIDRFDLDAAILFSDIMVPAQAMGIDVDFNPGPVLEHPVRSGDDVGRLSDGDPETDVPFVYETIRLLDRELHDRVPLIGFAAAPFTLAVYLVEGGTSKRFDHIKGLLFGDPATAHRLLEKITRLTVDYLAAQIRAGARAIQLFDTWAGLLAPAEYREFSLRYARRVLEELANMDVPRIYFALDSAHLFEDVAECGADVVGVDWRVGLDVANRRLGQRFVLQGNLDPGALFAPPDVIRRETERVLGEARDLPGHVFNLGHGIQPRTPIEAVETLVRTVRRPNPGRSGS